MLHSLWHTGQQTVSWSYGTLKRARYYELTEAIQTRRTLLDSLCLMTSYRVVRLASHKLVLVSLGLAWLCSWWLICVKFVCAGSEDNSVYVYCKQVSKAYAQVQVQHFFKPAGKNESMCLPCCLTVQLLTMQVTGELENQLQAAAVGQQQPSQQQPHQQQPQQQSSQDAADFVSSVCWKKVWYALLRNLWHAFNPSPNIATCRTQT